MKQPLESEGTGIKSRVVEINPNWDFRAIEKAAPHAHELFSALADYAGPGLDDIRAALPHAAQFVRERPELGQWFNEVLSPLFINAYGPHLGGPLPTPIERFTETLHLGRIVTGGISTLASETAALSKLPIPHSEPDDPLVSIIIVAWNGWKDTRECLDSLFALTRTPSYEVILVDNASTDETPHEAPLFEAFHTHFRYLRLTENLGFSGGNNVGADAARGRYLLFLNNDVLILDRSWLRNMVTSLDAHPRVGAAGQFGVIDLDGEAPPPRAFYQVAFYPGLTVPVAWLSGYCVMLRREAFEAAGRWRGDLYGKAGYEDIHLGYALRRAGWISVVPPRWIQIFHKIGRTRRTEGAKRMLAAGDVSGMEKERIFRSFFGDRARRENYAVDDSPASNLRVLAA